MFSLPWSMAVITRLTLQPERRWSRAGPLSRYGARRHRHTERCSDSLFQARQEVSMGWDDQQNRHVSFIQAQLNRWCFAQILDFVRSRFVSNTCHRQSLCKLRYYYCNISLPYHTIQAIILGVEFAFQSSSLSVILDCAAILKTVVL